MIKPINVVVPKFKCNLLKLGIHEVPDDVLPVMEIQETLEGEGINIGVPRLFIRVSGCAVGCTTCDTKDSWAVGEHPLAEVSSLADRLVKIVKGKVVEVSITGGEPLHYRPQVTRLSSLLRRRGLRTNLETSGTIIDSQAFNCFDQVSLDIKTPNTGVELGADVLAALYQVIEKMPQVYAKAVVRDQEDLDWLLQHFSGLLQDHAFMSHPIILTPCADNTKGPVPTKELQRITQMILNWNQGYNIRVVAQQHKLLGYY